MKNKFLLALLVFIAATLAGCTDENREAELTYRDTGIAAMESGDYESALAAFDSALSLSNGKIKETELDICYYKAAALYAQGEYDDAYDMYSSLINYDKKNADAYYLRGSLALKMGNEEQAKADYTAAVQYNSSDFELYIHIYENYAGYDMAEEGETYLQQAFSIKGDSAEKLSSRGDIYYLLGEYDNAETELSSAIAKGSVEANLTLGKVYEALGDTDTAENYYRTYLQSEDADSEAFNLLAEIAMNRGDYEQALDYISQGLEAETVSDRRALLSNQIIAYEQLSDFASAWEVIQEYVALYPDDLNAQREYTFLKYRNVQE